MSKLKISDYDATANNNTDVAGVNIDEGCAPSGINNAIRAVMSHLKDFQQGTNGDPFNGPVNGTIGATTPAAGAFTTLSTTGNTTLGNDAGDVITINGTTTFNQSVSISSGSFNGAIGSTTPSTAAVTTLSASGAVTLSGGTANGVAYLNGSKVLTTGSALTFDGTTFRNTAGGVQFYGTVQAGVAQSVSGRLRAYNGSTDKFIEVFHDGSVSIINSTMNSGVGGPLAFQVSDSEQMRLTSTGLGIGTSSPGYQGSKLTSAVSGSGTALYLSSNGSGTTNLVAGTYGDIWTNGAPATIQFVDNGNFSAHIAFRTKNSGAASNADGERMRIAADGIVGISTTATSGVLNAKLYVNGGITLPGITDISGATGLTPHYGSGEFTIYSGMPGSGTERARIDSSGNLLVGTTSSGSRFRSVQTANSTWSGVFGNTATSGTIYLTAYEFTGYSPNDANSYYLYGSDTGGLRFNIRANGGIANYSANNVNISDRREKKNFAPAKSYLNVICAIPVQTYNYIDQNMEDDPGLTLGVIAQDVQLVAPELVTENNWGTEEEPKMRLSIYQTDLQYALMKCIQEQQAIIETLKARLDAANL